MFGQDMFLPVPPVGIEINQEIATGRKKLLGKNDGDEFAIMVGATQTTTNMLVFPEELGQVR
jgi:hypothetical protein